MQADSTPQTKHQKYFWLFQGKVKKGFVYWSLAVDVWNSHLPFLVQFPVEGDGILQVLLVAAVVEKAENVTKHIVSYS